MENQYISMPMVALRGMTILPEMVIHFDVSRSRSIESVQKAMQNKEQKIFLVAQRELNIEEPTQKDVYEIGCIATIKQVAKMNKNVFRVLITGEQRAKLVQMVEENGSLMANVQVVEDYNDYEPENLSESPEAKGLQEIFFEYTMKSGKVPKDVVAQIADIKEFKKLVNRIAASVPFDYINLQDILEENDLYKRCALLSFKLTNEIAVVGLKENIQAKVKERMEKQQKEFILREQLKVIREELGEDNVFSDAEEFTETTNKMEASQEVKEKLMKEINRFKSAMQNSAENGVTRTYIETMLEMPWDKMVEESIDLEEAKRILEEDHYGLEKVKERILEFLAVRKLTKKGESPILCLVGPPGTGKTSIARSLSQALNRPYARISLGGVRDEAEIRGHRKTYVGAMPGRIANALKHAGAKNPLILLDEIDKVSNDYKGDTFSALLEVLDSEQNVKFRDHYLEVPLDLSEVMFVTTANTLQTIPRPLLDRMEVIEVSSYTENEKYHIAKNYLISKQMEKNGIKPKQLTIEDEAVYEIIRRYTREAGVRSLERKIGQIARRCARKVLEEGVESIVVTTENLKDFLGNEIYSKEANHLKSEVGIVTGLAWTPVGGDTLSIEVNIMPGKGDFALTGRLGDVMKESAKAGISYIRSVSEQFNISPDFFEHNDIHIHIPEGAVPKDGPSAGITMATAMLSAITKTPVRGDIAMTGEITLRGRVLPIGGLKEKILAAKVQGIKEVLVPIQNEKDIKELESEITEGVTITHVTHMDEVIKKAFVA